jgi:hypothetical protein
VERVATYYTKTVSYQDASQQIMDLERRLKFFEEKYHMPSDDFYQRFKSGELGDSMDFFEWNTYYEMWNSAQVKVSESSNSESHV